MLSKLEIKSTRDTPEIILNSGDNRFEITGNSMPEDSTHFFMPVFDWIEEYIKNPNPETHLICNFEYFNSSSAKMIYQIFIELEKIKETDNLIRITWNYESGDKLIEEKGLEYQSILEIPFEIKEL